MPLIRIVLLFLVVGGMALFAISNLSPMLSVVFLGMQSPVLPLSAWMGIAIAAGVLTSLCLQFLSYLQRGISTQRFEPPDEDAPSPTRSFRRETYENPPSQTQTTYTPPPPPPSSETPKTSVASDWEERIGEDWDFDGNPPSTSTRQDFDRSRGTSPSNSTNYETKQEPKTGSQTGSVYSYSYREQNQTGVGKADVVYDANYRVITPPDQKPVESTDDEDWGFEDDDDFHDQSQSSSKRR